MAKSRLLLWVLIAWPLPALLAGALGWEGIWGSGSALADYLMPIPVAGGVLHVPSFVLCGFAVLQMPSLSAVGAGRVRAALIGTTLVGVLWLLDLPNILLAWQAGSTLLGGLWQENPLGLFLASDGALGLLFSAVRAPRPWVRLDALTAALVLLPCAWPLAVAWPESAGEQPFRRGLGEVGQMRGDETYFVYTRLAPHATGFRKRAETWALAPSTMLHPRYDINNEDVAIMFSENLDAVNRGDKAGMAATLCLYEDGTAPVWLGGPGDCFRDHVTFADRLERALSTRASDDPNEVRIYLVMRELCRSVQTPANSGETGVEIMSARMCGGLPRMRDELVEKYPDIAQLRDPV